MYIIDSRLASSNQTIMELLQGTHKASKFASEDFISNMPDNVVTNILDRLPLQHAVRTSILSRNWRFKWTMLSQLVFDENFFKYLRETKGENNCGGIISRFLLHIKGVIEKFVLSMRGVKDINDVENINHWILFLSTKSIKDLTLTNSTSYPQVKLPTHLFSCLELKHLKLSNCCFHLPHTFHGFPNLLSLELYMVQFESELGEILARCPSLEILDMTCHFYACKVKLVDITKSKNLKVLSLSSCNIDVVAISSTTIFELVASLPKLHELSLEFRHPYKLIEDGAIKSFPSVYLKTLKLSGIDLDNVIMLSLIYEMIRHFQNLQTLEIIALKNVSIPENADQIPVSVPEVEYNTTGLRSVMLRYFTDSDHEVCLVKYLLACSPFLQKIVVLPHWRVKHDEQLMFARKLLKFRRASTVAEIDFC